MNYRSFGIRNILVWEKVWGNLRIWILKVSYGYLICKSKYGVKNAIASKQLYLNVVEDIDVIAKDVQHLLRYDILSFMATCDTSNILAIRDL